MMNEKAWQLVSSSLIVFHFCNNYGILILVVGPALLITAPGFEAGKEGSSSLGFKHPRKQTHTRGASLLLI